MTYNKRIELREKLTNGEISLELAKELYLKDYREGQRTWYKAPILLGFFLYVKPLLVKGLSGLYFPFISFDYTLFSQFLYLHCTSGKEPIIEFRTLG